MTTEPTYRNEEKSVLGTVANIKYYHQAAAWNSPLSFGVQAFIEYNGLVLNDRHQSDLIRVTGFTGLDDAEIRDSREPRPGKSGEFPYQAFYGGRNLVMNGFIEAGNLAALETLRINLKAAFASLEESPLKLRWFDIYDTFDDPKTILEYNPNANLAAIPSGNYTPLVGSLSKLKVENGVLSWKEAGKVYFIRTAEKRTFCDLQMTIKCIYGAVDNSEIGFILCAKNENNYVKAIYKEEKEFFPSLNVEVVNEGNIYNIGSIILNSSQRPTIGEVFWIRGKKEGNSITLEMWKENPYNGEFPYLTVTKILTGEFEELYGDGILSQVGIAGEQTTTQWAFDELKIESMYPGDVEFMARKISPLSIKDEQTSMTKFKRPFQIVMKASDYRALSSAQIVKSIYPTSELETPIRGRSYPRSYPISYRTLVNTSLPLDSNLLSYNNRGTAYVEPILYLYAPGENILIQNLTNGQKIEWLGVLNEEDYIILDCKEETIENSLGSNYLEPLVPTVEWIKLEPGWNDIFVQGTGFINGKTKFVIKAKHGYI